MRIKFSAIQKRRGTTRRGISRSERTWLASLYKPSRTQHVYFIDAHNVVHVGSALGASASIGRCTDSGPVNTHYGITHSILQLTECLYYGHSTLGLGTRVRTAALVPNDPRHGSSPRNSSNLFRAFCQLFQGPSRCTISARIWQNTRKSFNSFSE